MTRKSLIVSPATADRMKNAADKAGVPLQKLTNLLLSHSLTKLATKVWSISDLEIVEKGKRS